MNAPEKVSQSILEHIEQQHEEMTVWRRDIHANPELGFEETRTSDLVARRLESNYGINSTLMYDIQWMNAPYTEKSLVKSKRLSFRNKMEILYELSQEQWPVALGMMDHFRRICSINDFFDIGPLNEGALARILSAKVTAQDIAQKAKQFILPDL
ncbi:MAG: hypothetical protein EBW14_21680, partial [Oxalobacteraceae bacterium]|nr:hypothetical protein [Oxalobacteraceae bacterium]